MTLPAPATLFESHLVVSDLERSIAFYRDRIGLELAHRVAGRNAAFFWIGGRGRAMLGLWSAGSPPLRMTLHVAFGCAATEVAAMVDRLRDEGITPLDGDGRPTTEPVVIGWMPALSIFCKDPDDNLLEWIAMLDERPRPETGFVPHSEWVRLGAADVPR